MWLSTIRRVTQTNNSCSPHQPRRKMLVCLTICIVCVVDICRGGGVVGVLAPPLVTTMDAKSANPSHTKTSRTPARQWYFDAFERGYQTRTKVASEQEFELTNYLFNEQGYNPLIRPVANISDAVQVNLGLCMIQLIHIDERRQVMKSNVWLPMVWKDYQLKWDPAKYGGLSVVRVPHNRVWKPDIVLFNNADGNYEVVWQPNLLVHHDGSILWMPPAVYESSCAIDVEYFPFDEQECEMKFGSWAFDATRISMGFYSKLDFVDLSDYWKNGAWDLVDVPGRIVNTTSGGVQNTYIVYTIKLRRKTLFYTVNLIAPCVMISLLSICVFYLPSDAGEKVTLAISIVVALVVFLILVSKILPPTSTTVPLISRYLMFTFIFDVFAVFMAVAVVNWNYRSPRTHRMSPWTRRLFLEILPRLLYMNKLQKLDDTVDVDDVLQPRVVVNCHTCENANDAFIHELPESASIEFTSSISSNSASSYQSENSPCVEDRVSGDAVVTPGRINTYENLKTSAFELSEGDNSSIYSGISTASGQDEIYVNRHVVSNGPVEIRQLDSSPRRIGRRARYRGECGDKCRWKESSLMDFNVGNSSTTASSTQSSHYRPPEGAGFTLREGLQAVDYITSRLDERRKDRLLVQEWKYAASVIDRMVLVTFTVVTVFVTFTLLTNAPSLLSTIDQDAVIRKYSVFKRD
ncbi:unnamed protein product [Mesocestoides corti]|uniref:Neurotransmitter-gated ion-channel ligand-binding domain-containing protein n=5 Tax=Mesocestoides corti TaxID=53468 RepID=A0A0R3U5T0_MESCO|nr:unnamed protein product [Mesocestoides corti]